jgi:hypothetical protein
MNGQWGRAFLLSSSAKVLQCELNSKFPAVTGHCISAEGVRLRADHSPLQAPPVTKQVALWVSLHPWWGVAPVRQGCL